MWKNEILKLWPKEVIIYTDGASRGNPGPSSFGLVVFSAEGEKILEYAEKAGETTNNVAEYLGVRKALELASFQKKTLQKLTLKADSQLLIRQLKGEYKVKAKHLKPLFSDCQKFLQQLAVVEFEHVPRDRNKIADHLANQILDGFL